MVRYVIGLGLFFGQAYEEVMRQMTGTLQSLGSWDQDWKVPSASAITQARQRLGAGPLKELFHPRGRAGRGPGHPQGHGCAGAG